MKDGVIIGLAAIILALIAFVFIPKESYRASFAPSTTLAAVSCPSMECAMADGSSAEALSASQEGLASSEARRDRVKVIVIYEKGEGESDLLAYVAREVAKTHGKYAKFEMYDTHQYPEVTQYYGVSSVPAILFARFNGKVYYEHAGYLEKEKIIAKILAGK